MKRLLIISIILFGLTFTSFAQIKTSGSDDDAKFLKFYPNPATTTIAFESLYNYDKSNTIQIYNFMGKKVYELKTVNQIVTLSLDEFYRGIYIYQLRDKDGVILESGKFQVVK